MEALLEEADRLNQHTKSELATLTLLDYKKEYLQAKLSDSWHFIRESEALSTSAEKEYQRLVEREEETALEVSKMLAEIDDRQASVTYEAKRIRLAEDELVKLEAENANLELQLKKTKEMISQKEQEDLQANQVKTEVYDMEKRELLDMQEAVGSVRVMVRQRPSNSADFGKGEQEMIEITNRYDMVLKTPKEVGRGLI